jgi:alkylation response protein AidB-like acyl-CoA dehydrogenase
VTNASERLFFHLEQLAPHIAARAREMEQARRVPDDLIAALKAVGIFRMFVPRSQGGLELELPSAAKVIEALSRIEGSIGWIAMINGGSALFTARLPRETFEYIYAGGPDVIITGSTQHGATAVRDDEGRWRLRGRWPFASGCQHADWIFAAAVLMADGEPLLRADGSSPVVRFFWLPAYKWTIEDTWHVAGLKGTGSCHIVLNDVQVLEEHSFDPADFVTSVPGPLYQASSELLTLLHGSIALGIAQGALDDIVELAQSGRRQERSSAAMRDSEIFQHEVGRIETELRAAQSLLDAQVAGHWHHALHGTLRNEALLIQGMQTVTWISGACARLVDSCFELAGASGAIFEDSSLQRRMRDIRVATQHNLVQRRHFSKGGTMLLAKPVHRWALNHHVWSTRPAIRAAADEASSGAAVERLE